MSANESCVPLLSDDQMEMWDLGDLDCRPTTNWNSDTEGSTSGYDSSVDDDSESDDDPLDSDFICDESSDDDETDSEDDNGDEEEPSSDEKAEVMSYQSTHALCNQLKYIMSVPELCDVTFEVGANKVPVHGVKAIMATRSRTFYSLILKAQRDMEELSTKKTSKLPKRKKKSARVNEHLKIEVTKYDPEAFRKIVQFIHCGSVEVDYGTVTGVLCGAVQFGLEDLETACWDFVSRGLDLKSVNILTHSAQNYRQHRTATKLMLKVHEYLEANCSINKKRETTV